MSNCDDVPELTDDSDDEVQTTTKPEPKISTRAAYVQKWTQASPEMKSKLKCFTFCPLLFGFDGNVPQRWITSLHDSGLLITKNREKEVTSLSKEEWYITDLVEIVFEFLEKKLKEERFLMKALDFIDRIEESSESINIHETIALFKEHEELSNIGKEIISMEKDFRKTETQLYFAVIYIFKNYHTHVLDFGQDNIITSEKVMKQFKIKKNVTEDKIRRLKEKGNKTFNENKFKKAVEFYTEAIKMDPLNHICYGNRAQAQLALTRYREALCDSKRCIIIDKTWAKGYYRYAEACFELGMLEKALEVNHRGRSQCSLDRDEVSLKQQRDRLKDEKEKLLNEKKKSNLKKREHPGLTSVSSEDSDSEDELNGVISDSDDGQSVLKVNRLKTKCKVRKRIVPDFKQAMLEGSEAMLKESYSVAVSHYQKAVETYNTTQLLRAQIESVDVVVLKYAYGIASVMTVLYKNIMAGIDSFNSIISDFKFIKFPVVYYGLGKAYVTLNRFSEAVKSIKEGLSASESGQCVTYNWPGTDVIIAETEPSHLQTCLKALLDECTHSPPPDAFCRIHTTDDGERREIYFTDPDFKLKSEKLLPEQKKKKSGTFKTPLSNEMKISRQAEKKRVQGQQQQQQQQQALTEKNQNSGNQLFQEATDQPNLTVLKKEDELLSSKTKAKKTKKKEKSKMNVQEEVNFTDKKETQLESEFTVSNDDDESRQEKVNGKFPSVVSRDDKDLHLQKNEVAENLFVYFEKLLTEHGPQEFDSPILTQELVGLPDEARSVIEKCNGLQGFFQRSHRFGIMDNYVCVLKDCGKVRQLSKYKKHPPSSSHIFHSSFGLLDPHQTSSYAHILGSQRTSASSSQSNTRILNTKNKQLPAFPNPHYPLSALSNSAEKRLHSYAVRKPTITEFKTNTCLNFTPQTSSAWTPGNSTYNLHDEEYSLSSLGQSDILTRWSAGFDSCVKKSSGFDYQSAAARGGLHTGLPNSEWARNKVTNEAETQTEVGVMSVETNTDLNLDMLIGHCKTLEVKQKYMEDEKSHLQVLCSQWMSEKTSLQQKISQLEQQSLLQCEQIEQLSKDLKLQKENCEILLQQQQNDSYKTEEKQKQLDAETERAKNAEIEVLKLRLQLNLQEVSKIKQDVAFHQHNLNTFVSKCLNKNSEVPSHARQALAHCKQVIAKCDLKQTELKREYEERLVRLKLGTALKDLPPVNISPVMSASNKKQNMMFDQFSLQPNSLPTSPMTEDFPIPATQQMASSQLVTHSSTVSQPRPLKPLLAITRPMMKSRLPLTTAQAQACVKAQPSYPTAAAAADTVQTPAKNSFDQVITVLQSLFPSHSRSQFVSYIQDLRRKEGGSLSELTREEIIQRVTDAIMSDDGIETTNMSNGAVDTQLVRRPPGLTSSWVYSCSESQREMFQEEKDPCVICHEELAISDVTTLECNHRFHKSCLQMWFREQSTCPNCRVHALLPDDFPALK